jgi:hypothetical protein
MNTSEIFKIITPLQNQYKKVMAEKKIPQAIEFMWDIGEVLNNYVNSCEITPLALFREIYGKSEGTKNIIQKSYISREFQSRCLRIRRIFKHREDIFSTFPKISGLKPFIEAMPFFDNPKYVLNGSEKDGLIELLNSDLTPTELISIIDKMQKELIGINNPRNQHFNELDNEKNTFIEFYNQVYRLILNDDYDDALSKIDKEYYMSLSRNLSALSQDGFKTYDFKIPNEVDTISKEIGLVIKNFLKENTSVKIRRFRKLIPPRRMVKLAEMLYSFNSKSSFEKLKNKE